MFLVHLKEARLKKMSKIFLEPVHYTTVMKFGMVVGS